MQSNNSVVISAAGSRKTTYIVEQALAKSDNRILILTYTIENLEQIRRYFIERNGVIPSNVKLQSWFTFLLHQCVRPYQSYLYDKKRVESICFIQGKSAKFIRKTNTERYFFAEAKSIYTDKISEFACECDDKSGGLVIKRLEGMYENIYVDEVQDLAGYDLDLLELLFQSKIAISVVGDNRQATYVTNYSTKNSRFKGKNIIELFQEWKAKGLCTIEDRNESYRCNQSICDFADALYPNMSSTTSKQPDVTDHDGVFIVRKSDIETYISTYNPKLLRHMVSAETAHLDALNFGLSKGQTFDRVLIFPTRPIREYLYSGDISKVNDKAKLYVGITRARYSVAFVYDGQFASDKIRLFEIVSK